MSASQSEFDRRPGAYTPPPTLPGYTLTYDRMPALVPGYCNCCGAKLRPHQEKACSKACYQRWQGWMRVLGLAIAERMVFVRQARNIKKEKRSAAHNRALNEASRIVDDFMDRHRQALRLAIIARNAAKDGRPSAVRSTQPDERAHTAAALIS